MALLRMVCLINHWSSGLQMFPKIGALKNLVIITGKNLCWSLFLIKLQAFFRHSGWIEREILIRRDIRIQSKYGKKTCSFVKKRLLHRCFPVNIAKFLRTAFSAEYRWLSLKPEAYLEPGKHLRGSFLAKIVKAYKPLTFFTKKLDHKYLTGFQTHLCERKLTFYIFSVCKR